jgi:hypothetical protein
MFNLERWLPAPELDDMYIMRMHQANLDAMGGRAVTTIKAHMAAIKQSVQNSRLISKTPMIPHRGHMPIADQVGKGMAVNMLFHSLTAKPRMKGQAFI